MQHQPHTQRAEADGERAGGGARGKSARAPAQRRGRALGADALRSPPHAPAQFEPRARTMAEEHLVSYRGRTGEPLTREARRYSRRGRPPLPPHANARTDDGRCVRRPGFAAGSGAARAPLQKSGQICHASAPRASAGPRSCCSDVRARHAYFGCAVAGKAPASFRRPSCSPSRSAFIEERKTAAVLLREPSTRRAGTGAVPTAVRGARRARSAQAREASRPTKAHTQAPSGLCRSAALCRTVLHTPPEPPPRPPPRVARCPPRAWAS